MIYEYAVIGKGMIGSAAARYLSQSSDEVVLIGPDELQGDWTTHTGVFSFHYDQAIALILPTLPPLDSGWKMARSAIFHPE